MNFIKLNENDVPGAKLGKLPRDSSVTDLKRWLECHGLKKSGKRDDLVKRVEEAILMEVPVNVGVDGGKWYESKMQSIRINEGQKSEITTTDIIAQDVLAIKISPNGSNDELKWTIFPSINIPELFNKGHVHHFMVGEVHEMRLDEEEFANHGVATTLSKNKGEQLQKSGFVHDVGNAEDGHQYYMKAHVHHSMKGEPPLLASVTLSKATGFVLNGKCTCKAQSIQRCAHVGAILYHLLDYIEKHGCLIENACTSLPCVWNKGKKRDKNPQKLHEAVYSGLKRKPSKMYEFDPRLPQNRGINIADTNAFLVSLQEDSQGGTPSMWETLLELKYRDFELNEEERIILGKQCANFETNNKAIVNRVCGEKLCDQLTLQQNESSQWFEARWPIITASDGKAAQSIGEKLIEKPYPISQITTLLTKKLWSPYDTMIKTYDMIYGIENEPNARRKYEIVTGAKVVSCGLFVNKMYPFLGASPDGLIMNGEEVAGLIEIKCFKVLRNKSVADVIQMASIKKDVLPICLNLTNGRLILKKTHAYYFQIQQQLLVTNMEYCDFVLYSPLGPPSIERILRDMVFQEKLSTDIYRFWRTTFLPEYFLMKIPRKLPPYILEDGATEGTEEQGN